MSYICIWNIRFINCFIRLDTNLKSESQSSYSEYNACAGVSMHTHTSDSYSQGSTVADTKYFEWEPGCLMYETLRLRRCPLDVVEMNETELRR